MYLKVVQDMSYTKSLQRTKKMPTIILMFVTIVVLDYDIL